jgi:hypothetical protein
MVLPRLTGAADSMLFEDFESIIFSRYDVVLA